MNQNPYDAPNGLERNTDGLMMTCVGIYSCSPLLISVFYLAISPFMSQQRDSVIAILAAAAFFIVGSVTAGLYRLTAMRNSRSAAILLSVLYVVAALIGIAAFVDLKAVETENYRTLTLVLVVFVVMNACSAAAILQLKVLQRGRTKR